jgi:uncharacterized protein (TIGR02271 family)
MAKRTTKRSSAILYPGTPVTADSGRVGTLDAVDAEDALHVTWEDGEVSVVPRRDCMVRGGKIRVHDGEMGGAAARPADDSVVGAGDVVTVPILVEELHADTVWREAGSVRLRVRTEEEPRSLRQVAAHEELVIEEVAVGLPLADGEGAEPRHEGDVWIIPIVEEVPVVTMRRMVTKEVRVTKRTMQTEETVEGTVRRQRVEVDAGALAGRVHAAGTDPARDLGGQGGETSSTSGHPTE